MKPIVAITAFNIDRYTNVKAFLDEYRLVGMNTLELNGRVRQHVIDDLMPYIELSWIAGWHTRLERWVGMGYFQGSQAEKEKVLLF